MDKERLDQLIEIANKQEPLDLTHVEEARFVRDLDVPAVVLLWRSSHGEVRHWFAKYPAELTIASDGGITTSATAFWVVQPEGGFKIVDTPNGPMTEECIENLRPDGKLEVLGPTHCADCQMKTGIRGEWYLVHDQVWERAWPNSETTNSAKFFCSEILCVGCLEKRLGRQLTPTDFAPGWDTPNNYVNAFLEQHGGSVGEFIKFSKDAKFERISDGEEIKVGTKLICVFPETQHGWVKFNGAGQPPTRHMGGMFNGYVPPPRGELDDNDPTLWETGLSGKPQDPWKPQVLLPLKEVDGDRLYIFQTSSATGLRAVASLISECKQMAKREPDIYPVIELAVGAFEHKDPRVGTVKKPGFKVVGKVSRNGVEPPQIGAAATLNDEIPW